MSQSLKKRIHISGGFLLVLGWFGWGCGWDVLVCALAASAAHETGHWLALRLAGVPVQEIRLYALGAVMKAETARLSYGWELLTILAGPVANLLFAVGLRLADSARFAELIGANILLCLFNLLPLRPLDGGRAVHLCFSFLFGSAAGERISACFDRIFWAVLGGFLCLTSVLSRGSLWLIPMAADSLVRAFGSENKKGEKLINFCKKSLHL